MVKRIQPQTIDSLKNALIAAWTLIPQITIDRLCQGFQKRLELVWLMRANPYRTSSGESRTTNP
jgi:hypothetical protein